MIHTDGRPTIANHGTRIPERPRDITRLEAAEALGDTAEARNLASAGPMHAEQPATAGQLDRLRRAGL